MQDALPLQATGLVMLGGAIGAALRFHLGRLMQPLSAGAAPGVVFPWSTLAANVLGGLAMGVLATWVMRGGAGAESWRLFAGVGVLGGFTTFSAFSLEMFQMLERGAWPLASGYAVLSVIAALLALVAGHLIARGW